MNDRVGGVPVAVTWCPLCGSAVVYDRRVGETAPNSRSRERCADGRTLEFGVSGKLADDDLVMYDRETGSEWKQSLGRCIAGELEGADLTVLPASMTTWATFREAYPNGVVLAPPGGASEAASDDNTMGEVDYDVEPYEAYFEGDGFGLAAHRGDGGRTWNRDDFDPKDIVLGVERAGEAVGFLLSIVERAGGVVSATVGDADVVVFAADGVHVYRDPGFDFEPAPDGDGFRADGATWDGATGESDDGRELERLPARRLFAFAWQDDHGPDAFYLN